MAWHGTDDIPPPWLVNMVKVMAITCTILLLIDLGENWPLLYQFPGRAAT